MDSVIYLLFITILQSIWQCDGISLRQQLEHVARKRLESQGIGNFLPMKNYEIPKIPEFVPWRRHMESQNILDYVPKDKDKEILGIPDYVQSRRYYEFHPVKTSVILGVPSMASHLPEAEPILPGHTLIRPSLDMLRSSVKFPHKDMENGEGVYGNIDNLSIKYDGRNERVLYTGFRRMNDETMADTMSQEADNSEETRPLLIILRGGKRIRKRNKKQRTQKPGFLIYKSIYPDKYGKPKTLKVPEDDIFYDFNKIMAQLREEIDKIKKGDMKSHRLRKSSDWKRLPQSSAAYAYVDLDKSNKVLRSNMTEEGVILDLNHDESSEHAKKFAISNESNGSDETPPAVLGNGSLSKLKWFWNSKDAYNHVHIRPEAPEFHELVPFVHDDNTKNWWFFHEADFEPFENRKR